jgi:two-component system nitrate/nitrite response regulator NarL
MLVLTPREIQVVECIVLGKPNKVIAFELHLTESTVKEYLHRIFQKHGVKNRTELAVWAIRETRLENKA